ncbi:hypothetical protein JCM10213_000596 [Rhodosporidiobolus nylandii]
MRSSVALLSALLAAAGSLAAPSPKLPYFKNPSRRIPVKNFAVDVSRSQYNLTDVPDAPTTTAPHKNIWAALTNDEAASIVSFLHNQTELNLTAAVDSPGAWDNIIGAIDLAPPNKTETLDFLAGTAEEPPRMAVATLLFNAFEEPYVEDYLIGPLPLSENSTAQAYGYRSTKGSSRIRRFDADDDKLNEFYTAAYAEIDDIVEALLGAPSSDFDCWGIDPVWHEDGKVLSWVGLWAVPDAVFDSETILPQGIYLGAQITGRDPSKWSVIGWLRGGVYYNTTAAFRHAFENGELKNYTRNVQTEDRWDGTDKDGPDLPYDNRVPPFQIAPGGQRFAIDEKEGYVTWMDFSFFYTFRRDTALRLYDIKYKGERIITEFGLDEAVAHYAGNDPVQSGTSYLDKYYGFGPFAFALVEGYDCPLHATYVNTTFHSNEISSTHKKSICFFEEAQSLPMTRHTNGEYAAATKNIAFKMRSASTVGNYDYTTTYAFYLDGSLGVEVSASGYIQAAYYAENGDYGYHIHDGLAGSMHSHVLTWKADFDILGTQNTVGFHKVEAVQKKYDWSNITRSTMHLVRSELKNEDDSKLDFHRDTQVLIYNKEEKNKYGEERAYRIMPHIGGSGMASVIQNSTNLANSWGFTQHPLYVLKHHDSEFSVSHASNAYHPQDPVVDFSRYFDGENLEQEDLVLYINLGMHHVPHTGDLGNTVQQTAHAGVLFSPHNYLLRDPSRQTSQMIRINYNSTSDDKQVQDVLTFGTQTASGLYNLTALQPDFENYQGDVSVRKFPYDPTNPYNETVVVP